MDEFQETASGTREARRRIMTAEVRGKGEGQGVKGRSFGGEIRGETMGKLRWVGQSRIN